MTQVYAELEGGRCLLVLDGHATGRYARQSPAWCMRWPGISPTRGGTGTQRCTPWNWRPGESACIVTGTTR